jgi:hypothetical protein
MQPFIDYSTFPTTSIKKALEAIRELKSEGYPIDQTNEIEHTLSVELIDRKIQDIEKPKGA